MAATVVNMADALELVKTRLNRLGVILPMETYLMARIESAEEQLQNIGIHISADSSRDLMLVVDLAVWQYQNRDKPGGMPEWLRLERRERWLRTGGDPA